jgi:ABC-type nitrate/sulfonate/bicarbonate transport system permease component
VKASILIDGSYGRGDVSIVSPTDAAPAPAEGHSTRRRRAGARVRDAALALLTLAVVVAFVEALSRFEVLPSRSFPPVTQMLETLGDEAAKGDFWRNVRDTMKGWSVGLAMATALAVPLGIAIGASSLAYHAVRPLVEFLRPIPSVALVPLAVLVYGTGFESKVFLVVFASFWPIFIQTLYGMRDVDPVMLDTAHSYGLGRLARIRWVVLPGALPYIATGLRISSSVALILAVTAELIIGAPGLGAAITLANARGDFRLMYALIIATGLLGWLLSTLFTNAERRVLHWHASQRRLETAR